MTPEAVLDALKAVRDPDLHSDIVSLKFVKDVTVEAGRAAFTIESATPSPLKREALAADAREGVAGGVGYSPVDGQIGGVVAPL